MRPTAVSQVVEQLLRAVTALGLGYLLLPYGLEFAAAGAAFGAVTGLPLPGSCCGGINAPLFPAFWQLFPGLMTGHKC